MRDKCEWGKIPGLVAALIATIFFTACESGVQELVTSPFVTNYTCTVKDGVLTARHMGNQSQTVCAQACNPTHGCTSAMSGQISSALTLQNIDLKQDCEGNCGPGGMYWCGQVDEKLPDGTIVPYFDRWYCLIVLTDGACSMVAVKDTCNEDEECKLQSNFPYGYCEVKKDCENDADCEDDGDSNECTGYKCVAGKCNHEKFVGQACDDDNLCTVGDVCGFQNPQDQNPTCVGSPKNCNDDNPCTSDSCDQQTGECVNTNLPDGAVCDDDGDLCTIDKCQAGVCAHTDKDCDDGNLCTDDSCDQGTGECQFVNNSVECDDGDLCTLGDFCSGSQCSGTPKNCDDSNPCTSDSCDQGTGDCVNTALPDGTACADQQFCILGQCESDTCSPDGDSKCVQDQGYLVYVTCVFQSDAGLGQWTVDEVCGLIGAPLVNCIPGLGCNTMQPCVPDCINKVCGDDGCGGLCGECPTDKFCSADQSACVDCLTDNQCAYGGQYQFCVQGSCEYCVDKQVKVEGKCTNASDLNVLTSQDIDVVLANALVCALTEDTKAEKVQCLKDYVADLGVSGDCQSCLEPTLTMVVETCYDVAMTYDVDATTACVWPLFTQEFVSCIGVLGCTEQYVPNSQCLTDAYCGPGFFCSESFICQAYITWCWDKDADNDGLGDACDENAGPGYWSPPVWKFSEQPEQPPPCGSEEGKPALYPVPICCYGTDTWNTPDADDYRDCAGPVFNPYL